MNPPMLGRQEAPEAAQGNLWNDILIDLIGTCVLPSH